MKNRIDRLFIQLAQLSVFVYEKGLTEVNPIKEEDIVSEFYNKSINLMSHGRLPEEIDLLLSFEIAKAIRNKNIDDESIQCLIIIKKLVEPIRSFEFNTIIDFAKICASDKTYRKVNDEILQKYVKEEFENCKTSFHIVTSTIDRTRE